MNELRGVVDQLEGMDRFLELQFEDGWFELRVAWELLGWCRRESAGMEFSKKLGGIVVLQSYQKQVRSLRPQLSIVSWEGST